MESEKSFAEVVVSWRRMILRGTAIGLVAAVIVSLLLPRWYQASAVLTPPEEMEAGFGLMSVVNQISSTVGGGGRAKNLLKRTADVDAMIGVLKSRRVRGEVVDRFDLVKHYKSKSREHAIKTLGKHVVVETTPEGFVDVRAEARNAQLAADLTNALVEALDRYNRETSVQDAKRTSEFIRECLAENRERLDAATKALRAFQEEHGAVQLVEQGKVTVAALAELEAEKMRLQIQKGVLKNYARGDAPEIEEIEAEIREIDKRMDGLRGPVPSVDGAGKAAPSPRGRTSGSETLLRLHDLPRLALQYAELQREVIAQEKVYEFLTAQLEEARIREARDLQTVNVLDEAVPPIRKAKPRRSLIVVLSTCLAFAASLGLAFVAQGVLGLADSQPTLTNTNELRWVFRAAQVLRQWGGSPPGASSGAR
jgi:uncharacterized protein involved in exopolysaccharide biosynthesis